jgi:hypothetical protein
MVVVALILVNFIYCDVGLASRLQARSHKHLWGFSRGVR